MNLIYSKGIFMRTDIFDFIRTIIMNGIKPNYSNIARQFNWDSRTVKRYFLNKISNSNKPKRKTKVYKSILEPYTDIIKDKLAQSISFKGIYSFIKTKGFNGNYSTVRRCCCKLKQNKKKEAIIRFKTQPVLQAQIVGIEAATQRISTYFINFSTLMAKIKKAIAEKREETIIKHYLKYSLLIIDEISYLPIDKETSYVFFQLIAARYEKRSSILTTNQPFSKWGDVFGDNDEN